eukprot:6205066-Pleurochrysis_carterae.AAC.2
MLLLLQASPQAWIPTPNARPLRPMSAAMRRRDRCCRIPPLPLIPRVVYSTPALYRPMPLPDAVEPEPMQADLPMQSEVGVFAKEFFDIPLMLHDTGLNEALAEGRFNLDYQVVNKTFVRLRICYASRRTRSSIDEYAGFSNALAVTRVLNAIQDAARRHLDSQLDLLEDETDMEAE